MSELFGRNFVNICCYFVNRKSSKSFLSNKNSKIMLSAFFTLRQKRDDNFYFSRQKILSVRASQTIEKWTFIFVHFLKVIKIMSPLFRKFLRPSIFKKNKKTAYDFQTNEPYKQMNLINK